MKGVLLKDLYIAGSNVVVTVIMLAVLGFGLSFLMEPSAILILAPGITTIPAFISITSDVAAKWNMNVITMPLSRNKVIGEKYLLYSILAVLGLLLSIVICIILGLFGEKVSLDTLCLYGVIGMSATFLAGGLSLPCAYFFDADKAQIAFMISFIASTGIITGMVLLINTFIPVKEYVLQTFLSVFLISLAWFVASYCVSAKIYKRQDIV